MAPEMPNLPVVAEKPNLPAPAPVGSRAPVVLRPVPTKLTEEQRDQAFQRLGLGEKLAVVAPDFGLSMEQLRAMWAGHKRQLQRFHASGGQISCTLCARPFTPSESRPDTCARCSHE